MISILNASKIQFNSDWGLITLNNHTTNINNIEIKKVIFNHIKIINTKFPLVENSNLNIHIVNGSDVKYQSQTWEWSLGITRGINTIILKNPAINHISKNRFYKVLRHELNHIYLNRINHGFTDIPRWFAEGFCLKLASEISMSHKIDIANHLSNELMFDLNHLNEKFSSNSKKDFNFAYSLSAILVNVIIDLYGDDAIYNIIFNLNEGLSFHDAFYKSTLTHIHQFNNIIYSEIVQNYRWLKFIEFPNFLFILFPLLLVIAFCIKKYRNRKVLLKWEIEEMIENQKNTNGINELN